MRRRAHLKALVMTALGLRLSKAQVKTGAARPIQLFVEMEVDPKNEKDMLNNFHSIFVPEAKKHPGFISVKMLKFRKVVLGTAPPVNYRFELQFESEELRQKWIASPEHQRVWPTVEKFIETPTNYPVVLFDEV
jgi:antibiotic biosynthesis monooxygenase (ABM) superfamily enzyme